MAPSSCRRPGHRPLAVLGAAPRASRGKMFVCPDGRHHARIAIPALDPERGARRGGTRQPPPDAALRHDQAARRRHLHLDAAGPARDAQGRGHRARGDEPRRRDRAPDARRAAGGNVAGDRALGEIRAGAAAPQGSPRARLHRPADLRGGHHRHRAQGNQELQAAAAQPVSHPDEVSRRSPAALRRDALARIRDEGRVLVRRRQGGHAALVPGDVRRVRADIRPHGTQVPRGRGRHRPDRRQRVARIPGARRVGRGRHRLVPRVGLRGERRARRSRRPRPVAPGARGSDAEGAHAGQGDLRGRGGAPRPAAVAHREVHHARDRDRGTAGAHLHAADPRRPRPERSQGDQDPGPGAVPLGHAGGNHRGDRLQPGLHRSGRHPEGPDADRRPDRWR